MKKNKFNLFKGTASGHNKAAEQARVEELRVLARNCRDANNKIVEQLWDVEQKLVSPSAQGDKELLIQQKNELTKLIEEASYNEEFNRLLDEIKALEMALYGKSDIGSNSPYTL